MGKKSQTTTSQDKSKAHDCDRWRLTLRKSPEQAKIQNTDVSVSENRFQHRKKFTWRYTAKNKETEFNSNVNSCYKWNILLLKFMNSFN